MMETAGFPRRRAEKKNKRPAVEKGENDIILSERKKRTN